MENAEELWSYWQSPPTQVRCECVLGDWPWFLQWATAAIVALLGASAPHARNPQDYFRENCNSRHTIGGEPLVRPDLCGVLKLASSCE